MPDVRVTGPEFAAAVQALLHANGVPSRRAEPRLAPLLSSVERRSVRIGEGTVAACRCGTDRAVLLVHGWGDDNSLWAAQATYEDGISRARVDFDLRSALPSLDVDLLVIHSVDDERMPFSDSRDVVSECGRADLVAVNGLTHRRTARDPEVVARVVEFLVRDFGADRSASP